MLNIVECVIEGYKIGIFVIFVEYRVYIRIMLWCFFVFIIFFGLMLVIIIFVFFYIENDKVKNEKRGDLIEVKCEENRKEK